MVIHRDRLVLLSFMNPIGNFSTMTGSVTPQPFVTLEDGINENLDELTTPTPSLTNMALPDAVEAARIEATTRFSTVLYPIITDPPLSQTTSISSTISSKSTTSTEATSAIPKMTSLPKNSTVRRPTARPITRNGGSKGRSKVKNLTRLSTTAKPVREIDGNMTAQSMSLTMNSLADLDHPENLNLELQTGINLHVVILFLFSPI